MMNLPTVSIDGVSLDAYRSTVASQTIVAGKKPQFWSTPERPISDTTAEVLEINLNGVRLVNRISLATAHFPHAVTAEWFDETVRAWEPFRSVEAVPTWSETHQMLGVNGLAAKAIGSPVTYRVAESMPVRVNSASTTSASASTEHPQHTGAHHWLPIQWHTTPVSTSRVRLILVRTDGTPPLLATGETAPYSLGIKNLQIGYRVDSRGDVPTTAAVTGDSFGSSTDMLGSRVTFSLREQKAMNVLSNTEGAGWRSEPQPVNYAVVNFYVDTRDGSVGAPGSAGSSGGSVILRPDVAVVSDQDNATYLENTAGLPSNHVFDPQTDAGEILFSAIPKSLTLHLTMSMSPEAGSPLTDPGLNLVVRTAGGPLNTGTAIVNSASHPDAAVPLPHDGTSTVTRSFVIDSAALAALYVSPPTLDAAFSGNGSGPWEVLLVATSIEAINGSGLRLHEWWLDAETSAAAAVSGQGQVIDRFYVDPLTVGAHMNLYYSNDEPTGHFAALDEPLTYPIAQEFGSIATGILDPVGLASGMIGFPATSHAYVDVDNSYLQFDPTKAWWLAMDLISQTGPDGVAGGVADHPWLSFAGNTLRQNGSAIEFVSASGKIATIPIDPGHSVNSRFQVAVVFNPFDPVGDPSLSFPRGLTLVYRFADRPQTESTRDIGVNDLGVRPSTISLGRYNNVSVPGFPAMSLRSLLLKTESPIGRDQMDIFVQTPEAFTRRPDSSSVDLGLSQDALLRIHPDYVDLVANPVGMIGGPGDRYSGMTWTPVQRDYVLKKGFLNLPPTRAKFFKFEFTQLVAEHYESLVPINRTVKLFPSQVVADHANLTKATNWSPTAVHTPGLDTSMKLTDVSRYSDAVSLLRTAPVNTDLAHTATEALYVQDLTHAAAVSKLGWIWTYQPWHLGSVAPKFVYTQKHEYETVTVQHSTRVGFFVGLKALQAYRLDYVAQDDTERYEEHFHDQANVDTSVDMTWGDNRVSSYSSDGGVVTSKVFRSARPVRGVQFATVQTDSFPLLPDEGFLDPVLTHHWSAYGDASAVRLPNRTVKINRGWRDRLYSDLEAGVPFGGTYGNTEGHIYAELEGSQPNGLAGGGLVSEPVTPTSSGRVYVAAKISAASPLSGPVTIEIVSAQGDVVLSTADRYVTAGQEETFYIGYEVGSAVLGLTYAALESPAHITVRTTLDDAGDVMARPGISGGAVTVTRVADGTVLAPTEYVWSSTGTASTLTRASGATNPTGTVVSVAYTVTDTYGDLDRTTYGSHETQAISGDVYARVVQHGRFADTFLVKKLSVFDASLTWEFSNDGGVTWWGGTDVRNNPDGVVRFPVDGNQLCWRVRAFHPSASVSALAIRPWYAGLMGGIPGHSGTHVLGPNRSVVDDYPEIHRDPMWQQSDSPIPAYWYNPPTTEAVFVPPPVVPSPPTPWVPPPPPAPAGLLSFAGPGPQQVIQATDAGGYAERPSACGTSTGWLVVGDWENSTDPALKFMAWKLDATGAATGSLDLTSALGASPVSSFAGACLVSGDRVAVLAGNSGTPSTCHIEFLDCSGAAPVRLTPGAAHTVTTSINAGGSPAGFMMLGTNTLVYVSQFYYSTSAAGPKYVRILLFDATTGANLADYSEDLSALAPPSSAGGWPTTAAISATAGQFSVQVSTGLPALRRIVYNWDGTTLTKVSTTDKTPPPSAYSVFDAVSAGAAGSNTSGGSVLHHSAGAPTSTIGTGTRADAITIYDSTGAVVGTLTDPASLEMAYYDPGEGSYETSVANGNLIFSGQGVGASVDMRLERVVEVTPSGAFAFIDLVPTYGGQSQAVGTTLGVSADGNSSWVATGPVGLLYVAQRNFSLAGDSRPRYEMSCWAFPHL